MCVHLLMFLYILRTNWLHILQVIHIIFTQLHTFTHQNSDINLAAFFIITLKKLCTILKHLIRKIWNNCTIRNIFLSLLASYYTLIQHNIFYSDYRIVCVTKITHNPMEKITKTIWVLVFFIKQSDIFCLKFWSFIIAHIFILSKSITLIGCNQFVFPLFVIQDNTFYS